MMRMVVVLPQPDGPTKTMNSPFGSVEREVLDGDDIAEALPNVTQLDPRHPTSLADAHPTAPLSSRRRAPDRISRD